MKIVRSRMLYFVKVLLLLGKIANYGVHNMDCFKNTIKIDKISKNYHFVLLL